MPNLYRRWVNEDATANDDHDFMDEPGDRSNSKLRLAQREAQLWKARALGIAEHSPRAGSSGTPERDEGDDNLIGGKVCGNQTPPPSTLFEVEDVFKPPFIRPPWMQLQKRPRPRPSFGLGPASPTEAASSTTESKPKIVLRLTRRGLSPGEHAPERPSTSPSARQAAADADEDEDLQRAIEISLHDHDTSAAFGEKTASGGGRESVRMTEESRRSSMLIHTNSSPHAMQDSGRRRKKWPC